MAELRFACSHCGQEIECDELWSGHQIQCPTCQNELTVPPKPDAPPHAQLASARPGQSRLSIGASRNERSSAPPPPPPQMATLDQQLKAARLAKKGNPMKWVGVGAVVVILGVGGYFGYGYYTQWKAKRNETAQQASAPPPPDTNAAPATPPPPPKEPPMVPAVWTLDLDQAKTPSGKVNGMIGGTNFIPDTVRLDKVGTTCLLRFLQGAATAPDLGLMVYLHPSAGESVTGRTWTVTQALRDRNLPQVVKVWKTNPRYQATQKSFSSGYAMKLELGDLAADGTISGKIFLAVPDTEQSVVAGTFKATASLADAPTPAMAPNPAPSAGTPAPTSRPGMDRYNRKR